MRYTYRDIPAYRPLASAVGHADRLARALPIELLGPSRRMARKAPKLGEQLESSGAVTATRARRMAGAWHG